MDYIAFSGGVDSTALALVETNAQEEIVQDERGKYFIMFPNVGVSIRELRESADAQIPLLSIDEIYRDAAIDPGATCGLLCHK